MVGLLYFCDLSYFLHVCTLPCANALFFFLWVFHLLSKDFCLRIYPARAAYALRQLLVRFLIVFFCHGSIENGSFLCRRDGLFHDTVEAAVGADACYLYVETTSNYTIRIISQHMCLLSFAHVFRQHSSTYNISPHVLCAANRHSEALPYVAFLERMVALDKSATYADMQIIGEVCALGWPTTFNDAVF
jgi:hypothetical protein